MPENRTIRLGDIAVPGDRLRRLRPEAVAELAESIQMQGLLHAITVRPQSKRGYVLVAGRHRLEAVRQVLRKD